MIYNKPVITPCTLPVTNPLRKVHVQVGTHKLEFALGLLWCISFGKNDTEAAKYATNVAILCP